MKITKRQLRRIIREEKQKILKETYAPNQSVSDLLGQIHGAVDMLLQKGMSPQELQEELRGISDDVATMDFGQGANDPNWSTPDEEL
jgi:hypothetical protein